MLVDQVLVNGCGTSRNVTAQSCSLESSVKSELISWIPTLDDSIGQKSDCVYYFSLDSRTKVLARTVQFPNGDIDKPANSNTRLLLFRPENLNGYFDNPAPLAFSCVSSGHLIQDFQSDRELTKIEISDDCIYDPKLMAEEFCKTELTDISRALGIHQQVVVSNYDDAYKFLGALLSKLSYDHRSKTSFSIGTATCGEKPFNIHLVPKLDERTRMIVSQHQIRLFSLARPAISASSR